MVISRVKNSNGSEKPAEGRSFVQCGGVDSTKNFSFKSANGWRLISAKNRAESSTTIRTSPANLPPPPSPRLDDFTDDDDRPNYNDGD